MKKSFSSRRAAPNVAYQNIYLNLKNHIGDLVVAKYRACSSIFLTKNVVFLPQIVLNKYYSEKLIIL